MNAENPKSPQPKLVTNSAPTGTAFLKLYLNPDQIAHLVPLFALRTAHSLAIYQAQEQAWGHAG